MCEALHFKLHKILKYECQGKALKFSATLPYKSQTFYIEKPEDLNQ